MQALVIDENEQQRKKFQLLLDFIDYETVLAGYQQWTAGVFRNFSGSTNQGLMV